jgi:hypothetical protein
MNNFLKLYDMCVSEGALCEAFGDYVAAAKQGISPAGVAAKAVTGLGSLASKAIGAAGYGLGVGGQAVPGTSTIQRGVEKTAGAIGSAIAAIPTIRQKAQEIAKQRMYRERDPKTGEQIEVDIKSSAEGGNILPRGNYKITGVQKLGGEAYVDVGMPNNFSIRTTLPKSGEYSETFVFKNGKPLRDPQYLRLGGNLYYSQNDKKWKLKSDTRLPAYVSVASSLIPAGRYKMNDVITFKDEQGRTVRGLYGNAYTDNSGSNLVNILDPEYI